jgi:hypothetical protein
MQVLSSVDGRGIKNVPLLEFTSEGELAIRPDKLVMLGGNHRREALRIFVGWLKTQLQEAEKAMKAREGEIGAEVEQLEERVRVLRKEVEEYRFWAVRIYDIGESMIRWGRDVCLANDIYRQAERED